MSTAAGRVAAPDPQRTRKVAPERRRPQRSEPARPPAPKPRPRTRARRRLHIGFVAVVAVVVVPMILGLVALNAVLAQTSFRIDDLATKVNNLGNENAELRKTVAVASAPGRVYRWAVHQGMITPDPRDVHVLHPPSRAAGAGAGAGADPGSTP